MRAVRVLSCLALAALLAAGPPPGAAGADGPGRRPAPLDYRIFGHTLESSPADFRKHLKRDKWLLTKTETFNGYEVMSFTSARRNRLFDSAYVASCPSTGQTVGVYASGGDAGAILAMARDRFGIGARDRAGMPEDGSLPGPMSVAKKYRRDYANVSVSFYRNRPHESWTLALESLEAMRLCRRQNQAEAADGERLAREIEAASRRTAAAAAE